MCVYVYVYVYGVCVCMCVCGGGAEACIASGCMCVFVCDYWPTLRCFSICRLSSSFCRFVSRRSFSLVCVCCVCGCVWCGSGGGGGVCCVCVGVCGVVAVCVWGSVFSLVGQPTNMVWWVGVSVGACVCYMNEYVSVRVCVYVCYERICVCVCAYVFGLNV